VTRAFTVFAWIAGGLVLLFVVIMSGGHGHGHRRRGGH